MAFTPSLQQQAFPPHKIPLPLLSTSPLPQNFTVIQDVIFSGCFQVESQWD